MSTRHTIIKVFETLLEVEAVSSSPDNAYMEMFSKELEAISESFCFRVDTALKVMRTHKQLHEAMLARDSRRAYGAQPEVQLQPELEAQLQPEAELQPEPEIQPQVQLEQWLASQVPEVELGQEFQAEPEPEAEPATKRRPRSLYLNHHYWPSPLPKVFVQRLRGYPYIKRRERITHDYALEYLAARMNCDLEDFLAMKPSRVYERLFGAFHYGSLGNYPTMQQRAWKVMCKV